jgi:hypothetical protein
MPYDRTTFITRTALEGVAFDFASDQDVQYGDGVTGGFLQDKLFTPKPVDRSLKKAYQIDTSKLRLMNTEKSTNAEPDLVDEQIFSTNITLQEHKAGAEVNPRDEEDADLPILVGDARKTQISMLAILNRREKLAFDAATTSGNYPTALTSALSSGSRWNEAGGDPESDMITINQAVMNLAGKRVNAIAMGDKTADKIRLSPVWRARTQYTQGGPIPWALIKAFLGVQYLFVGTARRDSANEGATSSIDGFWSDNVIAYYYNPSPGIFDVSYGHMYLEKAPIWTRIWVDERRSGSRGPMRRVTCGSEYKMQAGYVDASGSTKFGAGYLLRTAVA